MNIFTQPNIARIVKILFWFTFILFVISLVALAASFFTGAVSTPQAAIMALTEGGIAFGLYKKEPWVVPLLILFSSIGLLSQFFQPVNTTFDLSSKLFGFGLNIFNLYFFTRKQVRIFFKTKSEYLFNK